MYIYIYIKLIYSIIYIHNTHTIVIIQYTNNIIYTLYTGKVMDEKDKCKACKGAKVYKDRKVLEVLIEKGMKNGSKIRFAGEADEIPG